MNSVLHEIFVIIIRASIVDIFFRKKHETQEFGAGRGRRVSESSQLPSQRQTGGGQGPVTSDTLSSGGLHWSHAPMSPCAGGASGRAGRCGRSVQRRVAR